MKCDNLQMRFFLPTFGASPLHPDELLFSYFREKTTNHEYAKNVRCGQTSGSQLFSNNSAVYAGNYNERLSWLVSTFQMSFFFDRVFYQTLLPPCTITTATRTASTGRAFAGENFPIRCGSPRRISKY